MHEDARAIFLGPGEGSAVKNRSAAMPAGLERFFERFGALPADASPAEALRRLGAEVGMVVGPPLSESDPL
jgi:hypothetical protein